MTTQAILWGLAGAAAALALIAGLAEWRRSKRRNLDRPGCMPWTLIQVLAGLAAIIAAALALKA